MTAEPDRTALLDFILDHFRTADELRELCYRLSVNYDDLAGERRRGKVVDLLESLEHRGRLEELPGLLAVGRPEAWATRFGAAEAQKPGFSAETRFLRERNPHQVFISHAQADKAFAQRLATDLRAEGWSVWIAPESIRPGERWVESIDRGLEGSGVFLLVLSPAGVASRWVRKETNIAVEMEVEGLLSLVPVRVAECNVPSVWRDYQYVSFEGEYAAALRALRERLTPDEEDIEPPKPKTPKQAEPKPDQPIRLAPKAAHGSRVQQRPPKPGDYKAKADEEPGPEFDGNPVPAKEKTLEDTLVSLSGIQERALPQKISDEAAAIVNDFSAKSSSRQAGQNTNQAPEDIIAIPVARFRTIYTRGSDGYDDSFSIENANGEFLGECGVGIAEALGVSSPKNVTALEVWLFDKNTIRTSVKLVMSDYAFFNEALRTKLMVRGELMLARAYEVYALETETLIVNAEITDMTYGVSGELPERSYFETVTIELSAWAKEISVPIGGTSTTYLRGDNTYSASLNIVGPSGEFLGSLGAEIAYTVGIGLTKNVAAFYVWLFDEKANQMKIKVVMSQHAYFDNQPMRASLAAKGELSLARPNEVFVLETPAFIANAKITDMVYGKSWMLQKQSYFERITFELYVWSKSRPSLPDQLLEY